jgi:hypothetical protein
MALLQRIGCTSAKSFGHFGSNMFSFSAIISANRTTYNLATAATSAGWNGVIPFKANITINSGVVVSGTGVAANASAITLINLPTNSIITINNNGTIVGSGGVVGTNNNGGAAAIPYPGNPTSVTPINFATGYNSTGYPIGPGAGGSTPGNNNYGGSGTGGAGGNGGAAIYLANSRVYLIINNSSTGIITGGGGGGGGQAGNNAAGGAGGNGGFCILEGGSHFAIIANNLAGGIIASGGGGSGGWGNRSTNDGIGGRPGFAATNQYVSGATGGNYGGNGTPLGIASNNTGTTLINTAGQFTLSPAV